MLIKVMAIINDIAIAKIELIKEIFKNINANIRIIKLKKKS